MVTKIKHLFIVTSAVNSKFGVFTPEQRLEQTLGTITSVRNKIPDAQIVVMECCGTPITNQQADKILAVSKHFRDMSQDADVQALYDNDNWDVVKNGTEIMCFGRILNEIRNDPVLVEKFKNVDRMHKMSGRYVLNDMFDVETYEKFDVADQIIIGPKYKSQFPESVTTQPWQYMARLWSWPTSRLDEVIKVYEDSLVFFAERLATGGYVDIEHVLARFLNPDHVNEIQNLGVEGCIAPNGQPIKN
jgi:hypothetical protein